MEHLIYSPSDHNFWVAVRANRDSVIVSPTDTVYGLATRSSNRRGVERIIELKEKNNSQFILLARNLEEVVTLTSLSAAQEIIVKRYWPGPITFILPSRTSRSLTVAIRIPKNDFLHQLMTALEGPILSTSCNLTGESPVSTIDEAVHLFTDKVDFYVDGGVQQNATVSTLVDLTSPTPSVLRKGAVDFP